MQLSAQLTKKLDDFRGNPQMSAQMRSTFRYYRSSLMTANRCFFASKIYPGQDVGDPEQGRCVCASLSNLMMCLYMLVKKD